MVELIGVPFDGCGRREGARLGPAALRLAGCLPSLAALGVGTKDCGDIEIGETPAGPGLKNFVPACILYRELRSMVRSSLERGSIPLVAGGDHSISIGSVSAALDVFGSDLSVLWIDAHADMNTPSSSPTGNLHGMPLAALTRAEDDRADSQWGRLLDEIVPTPGLGSTQVGWMGLREVDPDEAIRVNSHKGAFVATMYDIDRYGLMPTLERLNQWLTSNQRKKLWISFDVDVLDPILAPGTGTAVRGGLTFREMHLVGEVLSEYLEAPDCPYQLVGIDLVETNPVFDTNNETARTAVEWVGSMFGRTILGSM